jgi:hypothetical protein
MCGLFKDSGANRKFVGQRTKNSRKQEYRRFSPALKLKNVKNNDKQSGRAPRVEPEGERRGSERCLSG